MRSTGFLAPALLFASTSLGSAWHPFEAVKRDLAPLVVREPATTYDLSYSGSQGNTATTVTSATSADSTDNSDATTTESGSSGQTKETGKTTDKTTGKDSTATGSSKNTKTTSTSVSIDSDSPAGGVTMITPNALSTSSYYKIKDYVTFAWNYTSLSVTPSAIDILASCSANDATYTIAMNQSVSGPTGAVTWDTGAYQSSATIPLLTETYTLIIHDAAKDIDATASPGYFSTYDQFTFGMYVPQPYTPIADYVCATCNGALSSMERQTMGFMFSMVALTVLSFGWFAGVAGLW